MHLAAYVKKVRLFGELGSLDEILASLRIVIPERSKGRERSRYASYSGVPNSRGIKKAGGEGGWETFWNLLVG